MADKTTENTAEELEAVEAQVEETKDEVAGDTEDVETTEVSEAADGEAPAEDSATESSEESTELALDAEDEDDNSADSLTFSNGVIEKIVAIAVREVPGVLGMKGGFVNRIQETFGATVATKGVTVEVMPNNTMSVNISIVMEYGAYAPQVFEDVKKVVVEQVAGMTGLEVGGVNLRIEDVLTADEYKHLKAREEDEAE